MKVLAAGVLLLGVMTTMQNSVLADDVVTISGKKYYDVHDIVVRDNLFTFTTATSIVRLPLSDIPPALKERYRPKATPPPPDAQPSGSSNGGDNSGEPDPKNPRDLVMKIANKYIRQIGEDMKGIRSTKPLVITAANAFSADKIDAAHAAAAKSGKALAFFLLEENMLVAPADPNAPGAAGAFAQFFQTFNKSTIIVFVLPGDLARLPAVVVGAIRQSVPVNAPRIIFVSSDMTKLFHDLSLLSEQMTLEEREKLVYSAVLAMKAWYVEIANSQS